MKVSIESVKNNEWRVCVLLFHIALDIPLYRPTTASAIINLQVSYTHTVIILIG